MLRVTLPEERIAAVLHDVVEDNKHWTLDRLRLEGFSDSVIAAIDSLTHRDGESYEDFVKRAAANPIGRVVKRADLLDNLDPSRIANPTAKDAERAAKYRNALALLDQ
jgi:(p)ppGpp synthase/HD superfamily hydrolase